MGKNNFKVGDKVIILSKPSTGYGQEGKIVRKPSKGVAIVKLQSSGDEVAVYIASLRKIIGEKIKAVEKLDVRYSVLRAKLRLVRERLRLNEKAEE